MAAAAMCDAGACVVVASRRPWRFPLAGVRAGRGLRARRGSLTVYSGQHVQTTEALVSAFERETGISVNLRSDDEDVLADQIVTEGSRSPADVFYTENSPPLQYLASKELLAPVDPVTLREHRRPVQLAGRGVGGCLGPGERDGLQHEAPGAERAAHLGDATGQPKWSGQFALAGSETDFQPIVTTVARTHGHAAALAGWTPSRPTRAATSTRTTRPSRPK